MLLKYNLDNDVCDPHPLLIGAALQPKNALSLPKNKKKKWISFNAGTRNYARRYLNAIITEYMVILLLQQETFGKSCRHHIDTSHSWQKAWNAGGMVIVYTVITLYISDTLSNHLIIYIL